MTLNDLRIPPGNQLEALGEDRRDQSSIRINQRYRIAFTAVPSPICYSYPQRIGYPVTFEGSL
jgi:hypothetical protein